MPEKVGRNDPCPCGSGKKHKRCHGGPARETSAPRPQPFTFRRVEPRDVPEHVRKAFAEQQQRVQKSQVNEFGHIRPFIGWDFKGHSLLVMGNKILTRPKNQGRFFTDFLLALMGLKFGEDWWNEQLAKPVHERHPMFVARSIGLQHMQRFPVGDGSFASPITGAMKSHLAFAYDMFVVGDNGRLDERLIERLKNTSQFQGARHELFAEATCLRAGFSIEHENETDGSCRHAEFTARHKATGVKVSVEAKSKHRPGVMGRPGVPEKPGAHKLAFGNLLNDAIRKNTLYPLVVFLDLNLPWDMGRRLLEQRPPHEYILRTLDRLRAGPDKLEPITYLVITNHPERYGGEEELTTSPQLLSVIPERPTRAVRRDVLLSIHGAAQLYGHIPQDMPTLHQNAHQ